MTASVYFAMISLLLFYSLLYVYEFMITTANNNKFQNSLLNRILITKKTSWLMIITVRDATSSYSVLKCAAPRDSVSLIINSLCTFLLLFYFNLPRYPPKWLPKPGKHVIKARNYWTVKCEDNSAGSDSITVGNGWDLPIVINAINYLQDYSVDYRNKTIYLPSFNYFGNSLLNALSRFLPFNMLDF